MPDRISVYIDKELHRVLKVEASLRGKSLSEFMVNSAVSALNSPQRKISAAKMERIRSSLSGTVSTEEIQNMRNEGRQ